MRLASYLHLGIKKIGVVADKSITDLSALFGLHFADETQTFPSSMKEFVDLDSRWLQVSRELLASINDWDPEELVKLGIFNMLYDCELELPISNSAQIIGVGRNYFANSGPPDQQRPNVPYLFMKTPSSLVPSGSPLIRPAVSQMHDWEGELAVIIGRTARHVDPKEALQYVVGYSPFNGGSVRDWQLGSEQVTAGKNFWRSGGFGPYIVTTDEIQDPQNLTLRTRLNGKVMQEDHTSNMVFQVAELISRISEYTQLEPGDVIATGTPAGVGARQSPQRWLDAGDVVSVEIEGHATLVNSVEREFEPAGANYHRWQIPPKS